MQLPAKKWTGKYQIWGYSTSPMLFTRKLRIKNLSAGLLACPVLMAFSTLNGQWHCRYQKRVMDLQLRGQLLTFTGFPFNFFFTEVQKESQ